MVVCPPRMAIARAHGKAESAIKVGGGIKIAHRMDNMIETAGHFRRLHEPAPLHRRAYER